jgi:hypothetical protein
MSTTAQNAGSTTAQNAGSTTTEAAREPGSVMMIEGTELRTACGHSFVTCHTSRCFRLPPDLRAERDRVVTAAAVEHEKNLIREADRFAAELRRIETTYRARAAEMESP